MTQDRLKNLALLHIEMEFVNQVLAEDMERMIISFSKVKWEEDILSSSSAMFIIKHFILCAYNSLFTKVDRIITIG